MGKKITQIRLLALSLFLLFAGSLITALFFKQNKLWMDEILSYTFITDPSTTHLNKALISGIEQTPPIFFNLYWLIAHVVNPDVVLLKSVSIILFAVTLALFYRYVARLIGKPVLTFLLVAGLAAFTYLNIVLANQIRVYALFLLVTFLYFTVLHRLIQQPTRRSLLAAHIGTGLLLLLTHNFGLFYMAAGGAFFGLLWLWTADRRYAYVLGTFGIIGAVWLLTWYPYFTMQAKTGALHSWIPLPTWRTFFRIVGDLAPTVSNQVEELTGTLPLLAILRFVGLLTLFGYVALPRLRRGAEATIADPAFTFYLLSGFFYIVPILITLAVTFLSTSLFISRYLWPSHLLVIYQLIYAGYSLLYTHDRLSRWERPGKRLPLGWLAGIYVLGLAGFLFYQSRKLALTPTAVMAYVDQLDKKSPVFLESSINFLPVWYYNRDRPIYFLLDQESAFDPRNDPGASVGFYTLSGLKNNYEFKSVLLASQFTAARFPHFFVVDERWNYQIERFIQNKSVRVIRRTPTTLDGFTILECVFIAPDTN